MRTVYEPHPPDREPISSVPLGSGDAEHLCEQRNECDQDTDADKTIDHDFDMIHPTLLVGEVNDAFPPRAKKASKIRFYSCATPCRSHG